MADSDVRWTEAQSQRWLTWLAQTLRSQSRTIFQLEEIQPTWLSSPGFYYVFADTVLGAAIGALVAPLAIVLPSTFGPRQAAADLSTAITTIVAGAVLGALFAARSESVVERYHRSGPASTGFDTGTFPTPVPAPAPTPSPTIDRHHPLPADPPPKKSTNWGCGCLGMLQWIGLAAGAVLFVLNWLMSLSFANTVGLRNALGVLLVLIAVLLFRGVEGRRLRATGRFIRPAEALGWSTRRAFLAWGKALALGLPIAFLATRLLDGWLGNRPEAAIQFRGRGFTFVGQYGMGAHFFGLSDQGIALLLFLWGTIATAGFFLGGVRTRVVDLKTRPNQGMRLSLRNALWCLWVIGVPAGLLLSGSLPFVRPVSERLSFLRLPPALSTEMLASRLMPAVSAFRRDMDARLDRFQRMDSTARADSIVALGMTTGTALLLFMREPQLRAQLGDTASIAQGIAARLQPDRQAFSELTMNRPRTSVILYIVGRDRTVAGSQQALTRLFAPIPPDSLPRSASERGLRTASSLGLALGIAIGGLAAMLNGGMAVVRHYLLRWRLRRADVAPLDYTAFLDHACERLGFLEHVGGGYMFIHRMVLEHFAERPEVAPAPKGEVGS